MYRAFLYFLIVFATLYFGWNKFDREGIKTVSIDRAKTNEFIAVLPPKEPATNKESEAIPDETYAVIKVVDGDTIVIDVNGRSETVRLIGVDTPETVHPSKSVQCFGIEASSKTKDWLESQAVYLLSDPSQGERDKYGRRLAYVFRSDDLFINRELIAQGFAYEYTYNLPYLYQIEFKQAEQLAREEKRGLWADDACASEAEERRTEQTVPVYPAGHIDKDCPDFATQAAAQDYFESGGGSATYNFDRLDSDHDGVACETL